MVRVLPFVVELVLVVYCLIDLWQADRERVRLLPKPVWVLLILVLPLLGGVAWLLAGRPETMGRGGPPNRRGPQPPRGPDDDPDFLRGL
ncbi:MAG TPA: PLDc N-terminal domain-containing protein [Angustibacter sp.]|nr:PLDc N-terminal domain-containing protein [Angustibacter sp.]